ncbi:unnamed protein product [Caenorhabditis brenneri]
MMNDGIDEVVEINYSVRTTFSTPHLLVQILEYVLEQRRDRMYLVGTRSRQGDLKGFLDLRLVNRQFDQAVCASVRMEFRKIKVDVDNYFIRCNNFTIGVHRKIADHPPFNHNLDDDQNEIEDENINQNEIEHGNEIERDDGNQQGPANVDNFVVEDPDPDPQDLPSEDSLDALFLQRFFQWLAVTFDPIVEQFTIFDSWSFKPCSLPHSWSNRLTVFRSMHPDMQYCNCDQCIVTARGCHQCFGPMSFQMLQDTLFQETRSYNTLAFTDAMLADIALAYTNTDENVKTFDANRFISDYGHIRCDEISFAVQTLAPYRNMHPKPQPLEIIQLIIKLWEVKAVEFEVVSYMENDYYIQRCAWEETDVFRKAYFSTYSYDEFSREAHIDPYKEAGTLDSGVRYECLPIFDLRMDPCEAPYRMSSHLSLLTLASQTDNDRFSWMHQGRIAFNMFRAKRIMFISSGIIDFRGTVGTADWLKFTMRDLMRSTWGPRSRPISETGKTVYWIHYMDDASDCFQKVWNAHAQDLFEANFPDLTIRLNTKEAFSKCDNRRISGYNELKRPDVQRKPANTFFCSLFDPTRNNTTHIKFVQVEPS